MNRIFLTLSILGTALLLLAFGLGWLIDDPRSMDEAQQARVSWHMLTGLAATMFALLVHAIALTYFMGTGRWVEETSTVYRLSLDFHARNQSLKYRSLPGMIACLVLLLTTGALGAVVDPASPVNFDTLLGLSGPTIHFLLASITIALNMYVNFTEHEAISRNGEIVEAVLTEVRSIRQERGLPVGSARPKNP